MRISIPTYLSIFFLSIFSLSTPFCANAKVYIDINAPSSRTYPIAIELSGNAAALPTIDSTLRADIDFSGLFKIVSEKGETGDAAFWLSAGAEALIKATLTKQGETIILEAYLYDIARGVTLLAKKYGARSTSAKSLAHRFTNDIIETLTGEKGIFETKIAFISNTDGNKEIYIMDFDGKNAKKVTGNGSINLALSNMNMGGCWSPNGKRVVFTLSNDGDSDLFLADYGGKAMRRLTSGWGLDVSPSWSPSGNTIAYVSDKSGNPNIYIVTESGKNPTRITFEGKYNSSPSWSPSGDYIAYSSLHKDGFRIYIMKNDGSETRQISFGPGNDEEPSWSPDGSFLAFSSTKDGKKSIYIASIKSGKMIRLSGTKGQDMSPSWSPFLHN
jgi:TolB protein